MLIVAHDRLEALSSFLGPVEVIGSVTGKYVLPGVMNAPLTLT